MLRRSSHRQPRKKGLKRVGRRMRAWAVIRQRLKREFFAMGVTSCELRFEGCMVDDFLGFAHSLKRRFIRSDEEWREVVLSCRNCHDQLDIYMTHEEMAATVRETIRRRAS